MTNGEFGWQELYRSALVEANPVRLAEAIARAERAILERQAELRTRNHDGRGDEERQAIDDTLRVLNMLKRQPSAE